MFWQWKKVAEKREAECARLRDELHKADTEMWKWRAAYHDMRNRYDALAAEQNGTKRRAIRAEMRV